MSVSSGSSLYGDGDQELLLDEEEDVDFYALLNVAREATPDEINKAYRRRCLMFHPDRHTEDEEKRDAERIFVQLRRAHEILTDPKKKAIYDSLGLQGLDIQGWELVSLSSNPENIRREYEFLQRLKEQELMLQRTHPSSSFIVKSSVAGLFHEDPNDRYAPMLIGISLTQSIDCPVTASDRCGLVGRVKTGNGRGDGSVSGIWKRTAGTYNIENNMSVSSDAIGLTCRVSRSIFQRAAVIVQPQAQYSMLQEAFIPSLTLIFSMRLRLRWQGSIILSWSPLSSGITTSIVHTENNQPKAVANITFSPTNSNIRLAYYSRPPGSDAFTELSCQMSFFGINPAIQFERRLTRFSRIGLALNFTFPSCLLTAKVKGKVGQSSFEWQIVLCDDKDCLMRSALYGVVVPFATIQIVKVIFRQWLDKLSSFFDDHSQDHEVNAAKQEEASRITNLMRPAADRIRKDEEQKCGIVIVEARYGQSDSAGTRSYPLVGDRTIDVTVPLQAMVNDSQLRVYSVKSQLPGFYDPCPGEKKMLHVKYLFREELHVCTVSDDMPVQIPLRAHRQNVDNANHTYAVY